MNSFKRKALTCAVLAGLGGVATTAEAVYRNPDGTGQVLIFPYYTVNSIGGNQYNTYISVTNTTSQAKVAKVRFREGRTSAEVLDFNLYLSPNDVWVGAVGVFGGSTSPDAPAALFGNFETSCTYPAIPPTVGEPFKNLIYAPNVPSIDALPGTGLDRTREGYVEVFDMATLTGDLASKVTHTGVGVAPPNCAAMRVSLQNNALLAPSTGGLYGEGTIINVGNGASVGYKADALAAYASGIFYSDVKDNLPILGVNAAPVSLVMANNRAVTDTWVGGPSGGAQAVAAVFTHSSVLNDYILDFGTRSNTDWVLTFPGKHEFYGGFVTPLPPYTGLATTDGACEPAVFTFFDRDEQQNPQLGFSPFSGSGNTGNLCWETTVLSIRNGQAHTSAADISAGNPRSGVLGSRNVTPVAVQSSPAFTSGWMDLRFTGLNATAGIVSLTGGDLTSATGGLSGAFGPTGSLSGTFTVRAHTFVGLPVTGFMVTARQNNAVACTLPTGVAGSCAGNYAALFNHSYRTVIVP